MDPEVALEERNPILSIQPGGIQFMDLERKNGSNEGYQFLKLQTDDGGYRSQCR